MTGTIIAQSSATANSIRGRRASSRRNAARAPASSLGLFIVANSCEIARQ